MYVIEEKSVHLLFITQYSVEIQPQKILDSKTPYHQKTLNNAFVRQQYNDLSDDLQMLITFE